MPPPICLSRRAVLLGAGALVLGGCGIRLEDDAPRVPLVPTREPIPAEADLLALLGETHDLAELAASSSARAVERLAPVHERQAEVLAAALVRAGVPEDDIDSVATASPGVSPSGTSGTGTPGATPETTSAQRPSPRNVGRREAAALTGAASLFARVQADLLPTVLALHAQRAATAQALGTEVRWRDPADRPHPRAAVPYLVATRAAVYGFEVVAAQAGEAGSSRARRTLSTLRALEGEQEDVAGAQAPTPELGYSLPFAVTTPAKAARLGKRLLADLRAAYGAQLSDVAARRSVATNVTRWLASVEEEVERWGGRPMPFPGLESGA
jgi:hypothetical protein